MAEKGMNRYMKKPGSLPTMKDVAREAGVSLGTVSKVINGISVGESYRRKVEEASKKLGYQVNSYARALKTNQTNCVALILPSIRHPFFAALADDITAALMQRGYRTLLMITNYDSEAEQKSITMVRQNKVDGIIALTYNPELDIDSSIPFVTIDRHIHSGIPCVSSDNFGGGQIAARKLIELGCRNLLFMRIGSDVAGEADKRGAGFESICRSSNTEYHSIILSDDETEEPFFRYLEDHCPAGIPDFDGIFCNTDSLAVRVMDKLRSLGISIPEQVQVIGFDGIVDNMSGRYYCSTIIQPVKQMAETAVNILLDQNRTELPALMSLPVRYISYGTTKDGINGQ